MVQLTLPYPIRELLTLSKENAPKRRKKNIQAYGQEHGKVHGQSHVRNVIAHVRNMG